MKSNISLLSCFSLLLILCSASQCHDDSLSNGEGASCDGSKTPAWIDEIFSDMEQGNNKGEIIRYKLNGQTVFLINTCLDCADSMSEVYDCQHNVLCQFGGIAGFNTCPDFYQKATHKKVIWRN